MAIQIRRGTNSQWENGKSSIINGEPVVITDSKRFFIGTANGEYSEFSNINLLADEYSTIIEYEIGDICLYGGKIYTCTSPTTGTWDFNSWEESTLSEKLINLETNINSLETTVDALGNVANLSYTVVSTF